jgi:hypothetical protein
MRTLLSALIALSSLLVLAACPADIPGEQPPGPDAPEGTESGGAVVGSTDLEMINYGASFTETDAIKAKELLADPGAFSEGTILVEGTVVDVCQKAGCWMILSDGANQIRVVMKDHSFSVNKQGTGAWARVQGHLEAIDLDPETVSHLEGESQRPDLMPEKTGVEYQMVATAVSMEKRG